MGSLYDFGVGLFPLQNVIYIHKLVLRFGFIFGAVQSFGKVLFAGLIPEGCESEFFALSAISDRGSSWIGPLVVAAISNMTHDIRFGLFSIAGLFIVALPLIYFIDVEKGGLDAFEYAQELKIQQRLLDSTSSESVGDLEIVDEPPGPSGSHDDLPKPKAIKS